jgi:mannosyl-oligosaccharide glucosidase
VRYSSGPQEALQGAEFESELTDKIEDFDDKFESIFKLKQKGYDDDYVEFGMSAFSNLIGSLSYFYGRSKVKSPDMKTPVDYFSAPLFTGVPSRSFFPRGFLWDEGFHQLLITQWDINLSKEVIGHWMDLLNTNGWLPREQILGEESRSKVPEEFVVQLSTNGNPPTFFLTIDKLLDVMEAKGEMDVPFLKRLLPRLKAWFNWFHFTQRGPRPSTYQWKGRNSTTSIELNPKTLSSGLDDYPRPSHPSPHEYHVDLRCWLLVCSRVLVRIADIVGGESDQRVKC